GRNPPCTGHSIGQNGCHTRAFVSFHSRSTCFGVRTFDCQPLSYHLLVLRLDPYIPCLFAAPCDTWLRLASHFPFATDYGKEMMAVETGIISANLYDAIHRVIESGEIRFANILIRSVGNYITGNFVRDNFSALTQVFL